MSRVYMWSDWRSWAVGLGARWNAAGGRLTIQIGPLSLAVRWGRRMERLVSAYNL